MEFPNITDISINVLRNTTYVFNLISDLHYNDISGSPNIEIIQTTTNGNVGTLNNICQYEPVPHSNNSDSFQYFIQTLYNNEIYTSDIKTVYVNINYITLGENSDEIEVYSTVSIENNITYLTIDPAVYIINERTFSNKQNIQKVRANNVSIKTIKREAFYYSSNIDEVNFYDIEEMEDGVFHATNLTTLIINNVTYDIGNTTILRIPEGITVIGGNFNKNTYIYTDTISGKPVILPNNSIVYYNLTNIFLPTTLNRIERYGLINLNFNGKIKNLVIPINVYYIGWAAFWGHPIESIIVGHNLEVIRHAAVLQYRLNALYIYNSDNTITYGDIERFTAPYTPELFDTNIITGFAEVINSGLTIENLTYVNYIQNQITVNAIEDTVFTLDFADSNDDENTTFDILVEPIAGSYTLNNSIFTYTPELNFDLIDSVSIVKVNNNINEVFLYFINVLSINDRPSVFDISNIITNEDTSVDITLLGQDIEDNTEILIYTIVDDVSYGNISINKNIATYTPNLNYFGQDSFTYIVTDLSGLTSLPASVNIIVNEVNDPPIVIDFSGTIYENNDISFQLQASDIDIGDDSNFNFIIITDPLNGNASIDNSNILLYTPNTDFFGNELIQYVAKDARDLSSNIGNINITILDVYVPPPIIYPEGNDYNIFVQEASEVNFVLEASYDNIITTDASFIIVNYPVNGNIKYLKNNIINYKPNNKFYGKEVITYKVLYNQQFSKSNYNININVNERLFSRNNGCRTCPPKVIFSTTNTTYHNKSFRKTFYEINMRDSGSCFNQVSQAPRILPQLKNKF